jgi:class 3 adenylate cyclase
VNVASRLCNAAGPDQVLISEETLKKVEGRVVAKFVAKQQFKGKSKDVNVYEVLEIK